MEVRILITASRDWTNEHAVFGAIYQAIADFSGTCATTTIVHGACPTGGDAMADRIACGVVERHPADWRGLGRRAGFVRNAEMVARGATVCLAFIRNASKGATHTAGLAERAGIPVRRYIETG